MTGSMVVPCIHIHKSEMAGLTEVIALKESVQKSASARFKLQRCTLAEQVIHKADLMMEATAATPADPAARTHAVSTDEPPTKKRSDFFSALINTTMNVVSSHTDTETEIQEYLGTPCMPEDSDLSLEVDRSQLSN